MKAPMGTICGWIALGALILLGGAYGSSQDSSGQSLGDVARSARREHSAAPRAGAQQIMSEDDDGPDASGVWRLRSCWRDLPCYELSISLPKTPKWSRAPDPPRPVLIPLGEGKDLSHAIRVYGADSLGPRYLSIDFAKRTFLQSWFARPEYFGQAARLVRDERMKINNLDATITHFTVESDTGRYRGLSVVGASPYGNYAFACVFRDEDASAAGSICDAIIASAAMQTLQPRRLTIFPGPEEQPYYTPRYDDPE